MLISEYIRKKNDILLKITGLILVPENQITTDFDNESNDMFLNVADDASCCPYCVKFYKEYDCSPCPMAIAGNECQNFSTNNTYGAVNNFIILNTKYNGIHEIPEIIELVNEFNKSK